MHYKQWFEARPNKKEDEAYWTCPEGWHCLSKSDLKRIIEHSDILSSSLQVYMRLLKERAETAKLSVGFMNMEVVVKHIKEFIKRIHYTIVFSLSQDLDQNEYREDYAIDYAPEDSQGRKHSNIVKMIDDEKVTRRWIIDNNIHNKPYKLTEHRTCPQQNVSSSDCGLFVLHYMEAMCAGLDPNQEGGNQMRKKMLEEFAKLNK
ncbi:hypothetical protein ACLB2K_011815 [Fragaria x ananassa]